MTCQTCHRHLVAQRTWVTWDRRRRKAVSGTHAKAHSKDYCVGCYQAAYRSGFTPGDPDLVYTGGWVRDGLVMRGERAS